MSELQETGPGLSRGRVKKLRGIDFAFGVFDSVLRIQYLCGVWSRILG